ncbi:MAG: hypothetical protein ACYC42_05095 [Lysobacter sp.]
MRKKVRAFLRKSGGASRNYSSLPLRVRDASALHFERRRVGLSRGRAVVSMRMRFAPCRCKPRRCLFSAFRCGFVVDRRIARVELQRLPSSTQGNASICPGAKNNFARLLTV